MTSNLENKTSRRRRASRPSVFRLPPLSRSPSAFIPHPAVFLPKSAFTLIEVLAVVAIIAILSGLLIPAVIVVRNRARTVLARTEVKTLESAWRKYYTEYGAWPNGVTQAEAYAVAGGLWRLLQGEDVDNSNPRKFIFMQFSNRDADGNPVNPWWKPGAPSTNYRYYVQFDADIDGFIPAGTPNPDPYGVDLPRPVLVWTARPDDPTNETLWSWTP